MRRLPGLSLRIPGRDPLKLAHLVSDFNGTLACDGTMPDEIRTRLRELAEILHVHVVTGDTHGTAAQAFMHEPVCLSILAPSGQAEAKRGYVDDLGRRCVVAVGNGSNDVEMLRRAELSIAVIGPEGGFSGAVMAADIVVSDCLDALDMLCHPGRVVATLRA